MNKLSIALGLGLCAFVVAPVAAQCCGGSGYAAAPVYSAPAYTGGHYGASCNSCCPDYTNYGYVGVRRPFAQRGIFQRRWNNNCCPQTYVAQSYPVQSNYACCQPACPQTACCGTAAPTMYTGACGCEGQMYTGQPSVYQGGPIDGQSVIVNPEVTGDQAYTNTEQPVENKQPGDVIEPPSVPEDNQ